MAYDFHLEAGFQNLRVLLDTVLVPSAGTVTMDRDRLLLATADTTVTPAAADMALTQEMQAILKGPPMTAYRALSDAVESLYDSDGPFEASRRLRIAQAVAFDPVRDAPRLRRALAEIGDSLRVEALTQPRGSGVSQGGPGEATIPGAALGGPGQTTILYVNGILTDAFTSGLTWKKYLRPIVQMANLPTSSTYPVWGFYNPSSRYLDPAYTDFWTCLSLQGNQYGLGWITQVLSSIQSCPGPPTLGSDLFQSMIQVGNTLLGALPPLAQPAANQLADLIRQVLAAGGRVVVVAHSQGNLMVTEALSVLNNASSQVDARCVGVVSIAPPVPVTLAPGPQSVSAMIIEDGRAKDILLLIPGFGSSNATTPKVMNRLSNLYQSGLWSPAGSLWRLYQSIAIGIDLHSIVGSYLGYPQTVADLQSALRTQVSALDTRCPASLPNPVLQFTGTEVYSVNNSNFVRYKLAVTNYQAYPAAMFAPAPNLPPCGLNTNASRTWVNIYDASNNSPIEVFCGLGSPSDLQLIWFAEPVGTSPPSQVYIKLVDRATGVTYMSNNVVPILPVFAQLTAGGGHSCGLTSNGVAYCWGENANFGQLGDGTMQIRLVPTPVAGGLSFVGITAGSSHTCAVTSAGVAYCWGSNGSGELGNGTTERSLVPTPVTGGLSFIELTAGYGHTCGRTSSGAAYCWGVNFYGELGDGTTQESHVPTPVGGGLSFIQLTAGTYHTCGLMSTGAAYCWGNNLSGELGVGEVLGLFDKRLLPTAVVGGISFVQLTAETYNTCGRTSTGAAYCWGNNLRGQLGIGTFGGLNQPTPMPVAGGLSFVALTAGGSGTCGLTNSGVAYCWGYNIFGQLGDGTTQDRSVPTPVAGALNVNQLTKGAADFLGHTCGRTTVGAVYCWGYNGAGQLGDGTQQSRLVPTPVRSP